MMSIVSGLTSGSGIPIGLTSHLVLVVMLLTVTLVVTLVVLFLGYCHYCHQYWQAKGVFVPPTFPVLGHVHRGLSRVKNAFEYQHEVLVKTKVPYMGWYEILRPALIVQDPDILKNIYVKDFDNFTDRRTLHFNGKEDVLNEMLTVVQGSLWKGLRSTVSPSFTTGKLKGIFPLIETKCRKLVKWCLEEGTSRNEVNMYDVFGRFTLEGIATTAFGLEVDCIRNEKDKFAVVAKKISQPPGFVASLKMLIMFVLPRLFTLLKMRIMDPAMDFLTQGTVATMKHRQKSGIRRGDFMDLLLDAKREYEQDSAKSKYPVTESTIISQSVMFLLAGFQTTMNGLSFFSYLLAKHPEVQERIREEIRGLVETHGELNYQAIGNAKYLDACLHESLRLYPPLPVTERKTSKEYIIPGTDLKIEKGTMVAVNIWSMNRDPKLWEDPETYKPERFLPENKTPEQAFIFQSFGQGPRNCIGMRFATLEMKMVMSHLLLNMELQPAPGSEGPCELILSPFEVKKKGGVNLVFKPLKS